MVHFSGVFKYLCHSYIFEVRHRYLNTPVFSGFLSLFLLKNQVPMLVKTHKYFSFYTQVLLFLVLLAVVLYQARVLLIPVSFALLICFMYYPIGLWVEKRVGRSVSIAFCLVLLLAFGFLLYYLLAGSVALLQDKLAGSQDKIAELGAQVGVYLDNLFGIDPVRQQSIVQQFYEDLLHEIIPFVKQAISLSAATLAMVLIIPIFVSLILYYRELLVRFTLMIVPENQVDSFKSTFAEITGTYFHFAKGMGLVYLIVGTLNSAGFLLLGLPNAVYFGVLASLLTFFPYVGILIGGSAAVIVAWATFNSIWYPLGVVAILGIVQYLEANLIFPLTVGHQLKLNPLATLIVILLGGIIWGGAGIVLFVPFAAILKILADRVDGLQPLAVLLGPDSRGKT